MTNPFSPDYRIGDEERRQAIEELGTHYAEGRLTFAEYDERLDQVTAATMRSELLQMFDDLPQRKAGLVPTQVYTAEEVEQAWRSGRNIRLGIMGLTTIGGLLGISIWEWGDAAPLLFIIPTVFIMLYVMKLGPASWHTPSPRQLDRERMRQLKAEQRQQIKAIESQTAAQRAQQRAQREIRKEEINTAATEIASSVLKRLRQR